MKNIKFRKVTRLVKAVLGKHEITIGKMDTIIK